MSGLPDIVVEFLALSNREQMNRCRNGVYDFEDHGHRWVPITDHYRTRADFYDREVTVHHTSLRSHLTFTATGVPLTDDFRVLLHPNAQYLSGVLVVPDHDQIARVVLADGRTLTGDGPRLPWRDALPCECALCVPEDEQ